MMHSEFMERALQLVTDAYNRLSVEGGREQGTQDDFYVVWFCKTLDNWKALVSTDLRSGLYWEVTHNGDKFETYVDTYSKIRNTAYPD